ncbi:eukaryotic peptide chain release factor GTP-binding subunit ERF3A isoform X2 [Sphaeramia orbicularis]|uniref:eukaryotic peptide chain release factor GTP-binding subunit ERF3A isoform X2 n=1 Tax=Sphaeramia orbicularis TaxID=375764 RepID=UPI0011810E68|nr:uncharacterized protein LOC115439546 isoform X2 [Sphaeramia orbicularis]
MPASDGSPEPVSSMEVAETVGMHSDVLHTLHVQVYNTDSNDLWLLGSSGGEWRHRSRHDHRGRDVGAEGGAGRRRRRWGP